ncbi:hypothetical protein [Paenibacillus sp. KS-LC4]|uniref:hypothetical protein n=1 Tax=Paenibacillus sp. KS-LC4 TaxID=2979727 RepID=UPI0030CA7DDC
MIPSVIESVYENTDKVQEYMVAFEEKVNVNEFMETEIVERDAVDRIREGTTGAKS